MSRLRLVLVVTLGLTPLALVSLTTPALHAQDYESEDEGTEKSNEGADGSDAAGEPGRDGTDSSVSGGSGADGPDGLPGRVVTGATSEPAPTESPATGSPTPTPTWEVTVEPREEKSSDRTRRTGRSVAIPAVATVGLLVGAAIVLWGWRRRGVQS